MVQNGLTRSCVFICYLGSGHLYLSPGGWGGLSTHFVAPQTGLKNFVAPQVGLKNFVAPQTGLKNFVAPKIGQKIFVAPQLGLENFLPDSKWV